MDSFTLHAVGQLARDPDPVTGSAHPYTAFASWATITLE